MKIYSYSHDGAHRFYVNKAEASTRARSYSSETSHIVELIAHLLPEGTFREQVCSVANGNLGEAFAENAWRRGKKG